MEFGLNDNTTEKIRNVFDSFSEIEKVIIYGSRAKGTHKNGSDIDITLIGNDLNQLVLFQLIDKIDDLMLPYTFDISILNQVSNLDFREHVKRVGIVLYQKGILQNT